MDGLIFDVKGLIHPLNRVIAFVRYIPTHNGNRIRDGIRYQRMYRLEQRFAFLRQHILTIYVTILFLVLSSLKFRLIELYDTINLFPS